MPVFALELLSFLLRTWFLYVWITRAVCRCNTCNRFGNQIPAGLSPTNNSTIFWLDLLCLSPVVPAKFEIFAFLPDSPPTVGNRLVSRRCMTSTRMFKGVFQEMQRCVISQSTGEPISKEKPSKGKNKYSSTPFSWWHHTGHAWEKRAFQVSLVPQLDRSRRHHKLSHAQTYPHVNLLSLWPAQNVWAVCRSKSCE